MKKLFLVAFTSLLFAACGGSNDNFRLAGEEDGNGKRLAASLNNFVGNWEGSGEVTVGSQTTTKAVDFSVVYDPSYMDWKIRASADGGRMGGYFTSNITQQNLNVVTRCSSSLPEVVIGSVSELVLSLNQEREIGCQAVPSNIQATLRSDGKVDVVMALPKNRLPYSRVRATLEKR